jgi:XTP/dITP diphosphohydrolase
VRLVCASANPDKVAEIAAVLAGIGVTLEPRPDGVPDVVEDADTLLGNARLKAMAIATAAGEAAVADDTGLEVDALGGAPGVRSARYAGEHATYAENVAKLLAELQRVGADEPEARRARFRTVAMVCWPPSAGEEPRELWAEGTVEGHIALAPRGRAGFGYDSVFVPDEGGGLTFAEMTAEDKHAISHRGRALRQLAVLLAWPA